MPAPDREKIRLRISKKLARIKKRFLPMPHRLSRRTLLGCEEWEEYHQRCERQQWVDPKYLAGFVGRPRLDFAEDIWKLIRMTLPAGTTLDKLLPDYTRRNWFTPKDKQIAEAATKQALVIVLEALVLTGLEDKSVMFNSVFDALAAQFSDHFRASPAGTVWNMRKETAQLCRRDLLVNGISVNKLWKLAIGPWSLGEKSANPLYWVGRVPGAGYRIRAKEESDAYKSFDDIMGCSSRDDKGMKLLLGEPPKAEPVRKICAERFYNEVEIGRRSEKVLRLQEQARFIFQIKRFREDHQKLVDRTNHLGKELWTEYRIDPDLSTMRGKRRGGSKKKWSERDKEFFCRSIEEGFRERSRRNEGELITRCKKILRKKGKRQKWRELSRMYRTWYTNQYKRRLRVPAGDVCLKAYLKGQTWRDAVEKRLARYDRLQAQLKFLEGALQQAKQYEFAIFMRGAIRPPLPAIRRPVTIRSGFYRIINRRYQPTHLWPTYVTTKDMFPEEAYLLPEEKLESWRGKWFAAEDPRTGGTRRLVGVDISSSQTQIVALLVSSDALLEWMASKGQKTVKELLAEWALKKHCVREGYKGPGDGRLQDLVKELWMRFFYGSPVPWVVMQQWEDPGVYGPGWATTDDAERFLQGQPGYDDMKQFLDACRRLGETAYARDPYMGVVLKDPFDQAKVRWNPVERDEYYLASEGQRLILSLPGKRIRGRFQHAPRNSRGDYPVDKGKLTNMVAPCLVHMVDAYFSSLVMEKLAARGIRDFAGIHDCWLVPERIWVKEALQNGCTVLEQVINEAAVTWYRGLGPVYDGLLKYLRKDREFGPFVRRIRREWEARVKKRLRPKFVWRHC